MPEKQELIADYLQNIAEVFFNFVADAKICVGDKGVMTFLYDDAAVDYCIYHPNEWALYLSVVVRPETVGEFDPYLSFSPGLIRKKGGEENTLEGEWEHRYFLDFFDE